MRVRELVGRAQGFWRARGRRLVLLAVAGVGLGELALHLYFSRAAPSLAEWQALKPAVEQRAGDETLIVVAPYWAEPNARWALGAALMPVEHVARADETRFERALEIGVLGQHAPELRGWQLESEEEAGRFRLRRWKNPRPERVLYDFLEHVEPDALQVWLEHGQKSEDCPYGRAKVTNGDLHGHPTFPRERFQCRGGEWSFVGRTVIEDERYRPRHCTWAHPPGRGELVLHFEDVPLGNRIRGHAGLPYFLERERRGAKVELSVHVAGELMGNAVHSDGEGWKFFEFSSARFAGQTAAVEFRVRTARAWRREFCFRAEAR